ncbi:hypothetical protein [Soonwooa sp.]|uniref:tetratricopeptide repeat protein n=1 Tax=Soonwooa sp. TaxID=1938592 RepID=UPI00260BF1C2|nr:hypothetical protein [Soonwooa sp.]
MTKYLFLIPLLFLVCKINAQVNCEAFKYNGDTLQYKACKLVENIDEKHYQFSREFQEAYDKALEICPYFAYAYREKSVAYTKSGDFITWKTLMDKAVKYDEKSNLGYRGWIKYQFFKDYKGAIEDFEKLESLTDNIGYSQNGDYHLTFAKAFCYSALGDKKKAIAIMEKQISESNYNVGFYDYYQLGVTYFQIKDFKNARLAFEKQLKVRELAENYFYLAKLSKLEALPQSYESNKNLAIEAYKNGNFMKDGYTHHFNKVYSESIESL